MDVRLVIVPLCTYPIKELAARAEIKAEVEIVRCLAVTKSAFRSLQVARHNRPRNNHGE